MSEVQFLGYSRIERRGDSLRVSKMPILKNSAVKSSPGDLS